MKYLIVVLMMFPNTLGSSMASPVQHTLDITREEVKIEVVATMYQPKLSQTDSTPHILADGTRIDISRAGAYRYVAMSRDLLRRWGGNFEYGDVIVVEGAGKHSGEWRVKDAMNRRWTRRIDFLCDLNERPFKYIGVKIRKSG